MTRVSYERLVKQEEQALAARKAAAQVDGRHYSAFAPEVKAALAAHDYDAAAGLLQRLVEAVEREATITVAAAQAPEWFHKQLAAIYRRRGMAEEAGKLMQRYSLCAVRSETQGQLRLAQLRQASAPRSGGRPRSAASVRARRRKGWLTGLGWILGRIFRKLR